eukprot:gene7681-608_t
MLQQPKQTCHTNNIQSSYALRLYTMNVILLFVYADETVAHNVLVVHADEPATILATTATLSEPLSRCVQNGCVYNRNNDCQCDNECEENYDCCPDYQQVCVTTTTITTTTSSTTTTTTTKPFWETNLSCSRSTCAAGGNCTEVVSQLSCRDRCSKQLQACNANAQCQNERNCLLALQSIVRMQDKPCKSPQECCNPAFSSPVAADLYLDAANCIWDNCDEGGAGTYVSDLACMCPSHRTGNFCEEIVPQCTPNPCKHNGTCLDGDGNYTCICLAGYDGTICDEFLGCDSVDHPPCLNGANCTNIFSVPPRCTYQCAHAVGACEQDQQCFQAKMCLMLADTNQNISKDELMSCGLVWINNPTSIALFENAVTCVVDDCSRIPVLGEFQCNCVPGFTGVFCEIEIDECESNPCLNGGECTDLVNAFSCSCPHGFSGGRCEIALNCLSLESPVLCKNNASCIDSRETCQSVCKQTIDACRDNETCRSDSNNAVFCLIAAASLPSGECDEDCIRSCAGTIGNSAGQQLFDTAVSCIVEKCPIRPHFQCDCQPGFEGKFCEHLIDNCEPGLCMNGGTCVNGIGSASCKCPINFSGARCETLVTCDAMPCENNSTCRNTHSIASAISSCSATCSAIFSACQQDHGCSSAYNCLFLPLSSPKLDCDIDCVNSCGNLQEGTLSQNMLDAAAECVFLNCVPNLQPNGFKCQCLTGFEGNLCEVNIDECAEEPCKNRGTCIDKIASYECQCVPGVWGDRCENNCTICDLTQEYKEASCTSTADTRCHTLTQCIHGEVEIIPATPTTDRICDIFLPDPWFRSNIKVSTPAFPMRSTQRVDISATKGTVGFLMASSIGTKATISANLGPYATSTQIKASRNPGAIIKGVLASPSTIFYDAAFVRAIIQVYDESYNSRTKQGTRVFLQADPSAELRAFHDSIPYSTCVVDSISGICSVTLSLPSEWFTSTAKQNIPILYGVVGNDKLSQLASVNLLPGADLPVQSDVVAEFPKRSLFPGEAFTVPIRAQNNVELALYRLSIHVDSHVMFNENNPATISSRWLHTVQSTPTGIVIVGTLAEENDPVNVDLLATLNLRVISTVDELSLNISVVVEALGNVRSEPVKVSGRIAPTYATHSYRHETGVNGEISSGIIYVLHRKLVGILPWALSSGDVLNIARVTGHRSAQNLRVSGVYLDGNVSLISPSTMLLTCTTADVDVMKVTSDCDEVYFDGDETKGSEKVVVNVHVAGLADPGKIYFRVWFPSSAQIKVAKTALERIEGLFDPSHDCQEVFQMTHVSCPTTFYVPSQNGTVLISRQVDIFTILYPFLLHNTSVLEITTNAVVRGHAVGKTNISLPYPSIVKGLEMSVGMGLAVHIRRLDVFPITGISLNGIPSTMPRLSQQNFEVILRHNLTKEFELGYISANAWLSDGFNIPLDGFAGINLTSQDESIVKVVSGSGKWSRFQAVGFGNGPLIRVTLGVGNCVPESVIMEAISPIFSNLPEPTNVIVDQFIAELAVVGDPSSLLQHSPQPTSTLLRVMLVFPDYTTDMSIDERVVVDMSESNDLFNV